MMQNLMVNQELKMLQYVWVILSQSPIYFLIKIFYAFQNLDHVVVHSLEMYSEFRFLLIYVGLIIVSHGKIDFAGFQSFDVGPLHFSHFQEVLSEGVKAGARKLVTDFLICQNPKEI